MTIRSTAWPVILLASLVACGGNDGIDPIVERLRVTIPAGETVFIGRNVQLEVREELSDGSTQVATGVTWSSSSPMVATVSPAGIVTGVAAGETTITANTGSLQGTLVLRVFPNFGGTWRGNEVVTACTDAGAFNGLCSDPEFPMVGEVFAHSSRFTQMQASVNAVLFEETGEGGTVTTTGTITVDGELRLLPGPMLPADPLINIQVENWRSRSDVPSQMTGAYEVVFTAPGSDGEVRVKAELQNVVKATTSTASRAGIRTPATREAALVSNASRAAKARLARRR